MQNQVEEQLEIGKEYPAPGEEAGISAIVEISKKILDKDNKPVQRGQHAKHHGCVKAEFIVEANLPENLRFGVFSESRNFPGWIRFSNASGNATQPDSKPDGRGMAIKLMGVEGEKLLPDGEKKTQDFVMINHPVFFIRDIPEYIEFFKLMGQAPDKLPAHTLEILTALRSKEVVSPLSVQYWSTTPYKLGNRAMKFSAKPHLDSTSAKVASNSENYLREAMVEHLKSQSACFDFLVQLQTDPVQMPIEDPTIEWKSPFIKVATIKIAPQTFDSDEQMKFAEHLSFIPWHSLPAHQPLGGVNRARKVVYQALSELRHQLNDERLPKEPNGQEVFPA